jgi:hypothetical protein
MQLVKKINNLSRLHASQKDARKGILGLERDISHDWLNLKEKLKLKNIASDLLGGGARRQVGEGKRGIDKHLLRKGLLFGAGLLIRRLIPGFGRKK